MKTIKTLSFLVILLAAQSSLEAMNAFQRLASIPTKYQNSLVATTAFGAAIGTTAACIASDHSSVEKYKKSKSFLLDAYNIGQKLGFFSTKAIDTGWKASLLPCNSPLIPLPGKNGRYGIYKYYYFARTDLESDHHIECFDINSLELSKELNDQIHSISAFCDGYVYINFIDWRKQWGCSNEEKCMMRSPRDRPCSLQEQEYFKTVESHVQAFENKVRDYNLRIREHNDALAENYVKYISNITQDTYL